MAGAQLAGRPGMHLPRRQIGVVRSSGEAAGYAGERYGACQRAIDAGRDGEIGMVVASHSVPGRADIFEGQGLRGLVSPQREQ
jgi:hypothetical protein